MCGLYYVKHSQLYLHPVSSPLAVSLAPCSCDNERRLDNKDDISKFIQFFTLHLSIFIRSHLLADGSMCSTPPPIAPMSFASTTAYYKLTFSISEWNWAPSVANQPPVRLFVVVVVCRVVISHGPGIFIMGLHSLPRSLSDTRSSLSRIPNIPSLSGLDRMYHPIRIYLMVNISG